MVNSILLVVMYDLPHPLRTLRNAYPGTEVRASIANGPIFYLVPMLLDTAFSPVRESLHCSAIIRLNYDSPTLAMSLQVLPASRICFNLCSSAAVHGVFVRLRFLPLSSERSAGIETLVVLVSPTGGGRVSNLGLGGACLFRGFEDGVNGGGAVFRIVGGGTGIDGGGGSSYVLGGDEFAEAAFRGRLAGGGVLEEVVSTCQNT